MTVFATFGELDEDGFTAEADAVDAGEPLAESAGATEPPVAKAGPGEPLASAAAGEALVEDAGAGVGDAVGSVDAAVVAKARVFVRRRGLPRAGDGEAAVAVGVGLGEGEGGGDPSWSVMPKPSRDGSGSAPISAVRKTAPSSERWRDCVLVAPAGPTGCPYGCVCGILSPGPLPRLP